MPKPAYKKNPIDISIDSLPLTTKLAIGTLALVHVVCPLLFLTNLTRNPYYTQITLLNIGITLAALLWTVQVWINGELRFPRFPFEIPLMILLAVALASTVFSWLNHPA